jgi:hypothetical protein
MKWYNGTFLNGTLHSSTLQNGTALKNGTVIEQGKMVHVEKTVHLLYKTQYTDVMGCYITVHYSHNQQGSTNPWIGWALSQSKPNPGEGQSQPI